MTEKEIKGLREAFNINMDDFSYYDIEELQTDGRLKEFWKSLTLEECESIMSQVRKEYDELNDEYHNGDSLCYPPDWWDQYVFPIDRVLAMIREHHSDMMNQLDEEESEDY